MSLKAVKALNGTLIPLCFITDVRLLPEECTGDSEHDTQNTWRVVVNTSCMGTHTIFESADYDNTSKWFHFLDAVKGKNYETALKRKEEIEEARQEELNGIVYI